MSRCKNRPDHMPHDVVMRHPMLRRLCDLGLPTRDFVVAGSAPLLLHGFREHIADVDVVARGSAWAMAQRLGPLGTSPYQRRGVIRLVGGTIEIFDGWFPWWFVEDDLFRRAERVGGVNFMCLEDTWDWKACLARDKDVADLRRSTVGLQHMSWVPDRTRPGRWPLEPK